MASSPTVLAGTDLTADLLSTPAWTPMTPLLNSWANIGGGDTTAQYRLWKLRNAVECIGTITGGANATIFFNLPAGFRPASLQSPEAQASTFVQVDTSGNMTVQGYTSGGFYFHLDIPLDA